MRNSGRIEAIAKGLNIFDYMEIRTNVSELRKHELISAHDTIGEQVVGAGAGSSGQGPAAQVQAPPPAPTAPAPQASPAAAADP